MALLFNDPCDNFTFAPWTVNGSVTVTGSGHTGNGFSFPSASTNFVTYDIASGNQTDTLTVGCWFKFSTISTSPKLFDFRSDAGATEHAFVRVSSIAGLEIVRATNTTLATDASNLITVAGTWYYVEAQIVLHDTTGSVAVRLNGTQVCSATNVDTKNAGTKTVFDQLRIVSGASSGTWFTDDIYLRNDTTFGTAATFVGTGTGAIVFDGSGTATAAYTGTGTGAIAFAGSGTTTGAATFVGTGTGAIVFDGAGTARTGTAGDGHITFAGYGDTDVTPRLDVYAPPEWSWQLVDPATGNPAGPLTVAAARKLTFQLDGPATAQFTLPGQHPQTAAIAELATDVAVARNGRPLFRGRVGASTETHSATADTVNFTAVDYRGMLAHRVLWPDSTLEFAGVDQSDIAWRILADTQALPGGDWGVTRGAGQVTGVTRDRTYTAGTTAAQVLTDLGNVADGFDWDIDPNLAFNVYHPQRGRSTGVVLVYGRDVIAATTTVDPSKYANAVYYTGATPQTSPATPTAAPPAGVGRWELQQSDVNATLQGTVDDEATGALAADSQLISALTLTLAPATWNPYRLWLGDSVRAVIRTGRLDIDVTRRVTQIDVTVGDDGAETVVVAVGATPPKLSDRLNSLQSQISALQLAPGIGNPDNYGGTDGTGGTGGGGGGITEITSSDGSIVVTNASGPVTDLAVAAGGIIVVSNPFGPVTDLRIGTTETVTNHYHSLTLTSFPPANPNVAAWAFSFTEPTTWLDIITVPAGFPDHPEGNGFAGQIVAGGRYHLEITVAGLGSLTSDPDDASIALYPTTVVYIPDLTASSIAGGGPFNPSPDADPVTFTTTQDIAVPNMYAIAQMFIGTGESTRGFDISCLVDVDISLTRTG